MSNQMDASAAAYRAYQNMVRRCGGGGGSEKSSGYQCVLLFVGLRSRESVAYTSVQLSGDGDRDERHDALFADDRRFSSGTGRLLLHADDGRQAILL